MERDRVPEELSAQVDSVAEHLAVLRGGGIFLSSVDGRILIRWLEQGIPAAVIVVALERVAERRRKRRTQTPLRLASCKGEVKRLWGRHLDDGGAPGGVTAGHELAPAGVATSSDGGPPGGDLPSLEAGVIAEIGGISIDDPHRGDRAMALVRSFHRRAWELSASEHATLRAQAEEELGAFRSSMEEARFHEMVEEVARDLLRQRFPGLSAGAVWDRLHGS